MIRIQVKIERTMIILWVELDLTVDEGMNKSWMKYD